MRSRRIFRFAAICLLTASLAADGAPANELDLHAFLGELRRLETAISSASPDQLASIRDSIPAAWTVRDGAETYTVSLAWLRRGFEEGRRDPAQWAGSRAVIIARLQGMHREGAALESAPGANDGASRALLDAVLAREEFQRNAGEGALARIRSNVMNWVLSMWDRLGGARLGRRSTAVALAWVASLGALAALSWWVVSMIVRSGATSRLTLTVPPARRRTARAWAALAAAAADPREAVRCAYSAALVRLEEEGTWRVDEARTPREHLRLLPAGHRRRVPFDDVVRRFEEIWFGARAATGDDTRAALARLKELGCLSAD